MGLLWSVGHGPQLAVLFQPGAAAASHDKDDELDYAHHGHEQHADEHDTKQHDGNNDNNNVDQHDELVDDGVYGVYDSIK